MASAKCISSRFIWITNIIGGLPTAHQIFLGLLHLPEIDGPCFYKTPLHPLLVQSYILLDFEKISMKCTALVYCYRQACFQLCQSTLFLNRMSAAHSLFHSPCCYSKNILYFNQPTNPVTSGDHKLSFYKCFKQQPLQPF